MKSKLLPAAVIFLLLTVLRIGYLKVLDKNNVAAVNTADTHGLKSEITALGRNLWQKDQSVYVSSEESNSITLHSDDAIPPDVSELFPLNLMIEQNLSSPPAKANQQAHSSRLPSLTDSGQSEVQAKSLSADIPPQPELSEKQQAFHLQQADFADLAVPANASYEMPIANFEYTCPAKVSSICGFGYRIHPIYGDARFHYGVDYPLFDGDEISAFADGTVISVETISGYGLCLLLEHSDGFTTLYAHCSQVLVKQGDTVAMGQKVALAGHSGRVTGPHLHFELMKDGKKVNPEFYV